MVLVNADDGAKLVTTIVLLRCRCRQIAVRDGDAALRPIAGRQHLLVLGPRWVLDVVNDSHARALRIDEEQLLDAKFAIEDVLGLVAFVRGAALGVVADAGHQMFHVRARGIHRCAIGGEDREAARATTHVALIGCDEVFVGDPCDTVRLARHSCNGFVLHNEVRVFGTVDFVKVDRAGRNGAEDSGANQVDHHQSIILLQRHNRHIVLVDLNELRLGITRRHAHVRQVRQGDISDSPR